MHQFGKYCFVREWPGLWYLLAKYLGATLQEIKQLWQGASASRRWQMLFLSLGMQTEVPTEILNDVLAEMVASLLPQGPSTPGRKSKAAAANSPVSPADALSPVKLELGANRLHGNRPAKFGQPPKVPSTLQPKQKGKVGEEGGPESGKRRVSNTSKSSKSTKLKDSDSEDSLRWWM